MTKNIIIGTLITIIILYLGTIIIRDYNTRMNEYNYHMCVETYGLDENCQ